MTTAVSTENPTTRYGKATDLGFDATDGAWVAQCVTHNMIANLPTRDLARAASKNTASFCDECRAEAPDTAPEDNNPEPDAEPETEDTFVAPPKRYLPDPEPPTAEEQDHLTDALDGLDDTPDDAATRPAVLGTFFANGSGTAHNAAAISNLYMTTVCGKTTLMGEPTAVGRPGSLHLLLGWHPCANRDGAEST